MTEGGNGLHVGRDKQGFVNPQQTGGVLDLEGGAVEDDSLGEFAYRDDDDRRGHFDKFVETMRTCLDLGSRGGSDVAPFVDGSAGDEIGVGDGG